MKLVMTYSAGDGCTYWCEVTHPFEYESVERAEYDFLDLCEGVLGREEENRNTYFKFLGEEFNAFDFFSREEIKSKKGDIKDIKYHYEGPMIRTLEDWFEQEKFKNVT